MIRYTSFILAAALSFSGFQASAFDLKDLLNGSSKSDTAKSQSSLGGLIGGLISTDRLSLESLKGNWKYSSPAVSFRSENILMKAGGTAAATTVEQKLEPYYKSLGFNNLTIDIKADGTFAMKVRGVNLNGVIAKSETDSKTGANFVMSFNALGKKQIGKLNAYVTKNASGEMDMTFDVTKLIELMEKVSSITGNSTITGVTKLLSSYDGICAGFSLKSK